MTGRPSTAGEWNESALRILRERYLVKDASGNVVETPEEMCWRVATTIARAERRWGLDDEAVGVLAISFHDLMVERVFLPNSPTLMNAGRGSGLQYSACYVLPVGDSMEEIFDAVKNAAVVHKSGGGTGFSFSRLRQKDALVGSTGGRSSGPVSFLRVFDSATEAVKQGGTRRGANMGVLRVDHPDILEFIDAKRDGGIVNFNLSAAVTDAFMEALARSADYDLVAPHTGQVAGRLAAREVWDRIARAAWETGDPGVVFIDRINSSRANPTPALALIEATNPCGEQSLAPNDACNLGSINVSALARRSADGPWSLDWTELCRVTRLAVRFLDDVIDVNPYPLPEIDRVVKQNRRIGLGIMGWADLLFRLGIPYDSDEALALAERSMSAIQTAGHAESQRLAAERGAFPTFAQSIYKDGPPVRNSTVTTIAPTGTISMIAGCSSGIEPAFALAFTHTVGERRLTFVAPVFQQVAREQGFASEELVASVAHTGTLRGIDGVPEEVRRVFVTAHEIAPAWHVRQQAAFQKHTDNGVSKTINLPNAATAADVRGAYDLAWELGCLGITVFRDGSKQGVLQVGAGRHEETRPIESAPTDEPILEPRPPSLPGRTHRVETPLGTAFVAVNEDDAGEPFEVFVSVGKAGSDTMAVAEAIGRLVSLALRVPSPIPRTQRLHEIIAQLSGIGGSRSLGFGSERILSLPDGIARALARHLGAVAERPGDLCPECGNFSLAREEGCTLCQACGFSEC